MGSLVDLLIVSKYFEVICPIRERPLGVVIYTQTRPLHHRPRPKLLPVALRSNGDKLLLIFCDMAIDTGDNGAL